MVKVSAGCVTSQCVVKPSLTHPAMNELKGKLVTRTQYANCRTPARMRKSRKLSMSLRRAGVLSLYDLISVETALLAVSPDEAEPADEETGGRELYPEACQSAVTETQAFSS